MNIEQLCCVSVGVIVQAMTFALGVLVGISLMRKEPNRESEKARTEAAKCCR